MLLFLSVPCLPRIAGFLPQDFGIKYNCENGGPAPEKLTNLIYSNTRAIAKYVTCESFPEVDVSELGSVVVAAGDDSCEVNIDVVSGELVLRSQCSRIPRSRRPSRWP